MKDYNARDTRVALNFGIDMIKDNILPQRAPRFASQLQWGLMDELKVDQFAQWLLKYSLISDSTIDALHNLFTNSYLRLL